MTRVTSVTALGLDACLKSKDKEINCHVPFLLKIGLGNIYIHLTFSCISFLSNPAFRKVTLLDCLHLKKKTLAHHLKRDMNAKPNLKTCVASTDFCRIQHNLDAAQ